jgi:hypothetical protein
VHIVSKLTYGQHNRLRSTLRELALQIEDLARLLGSGKKLERIVPIEDTPLETECVRVLEVLSDLYDALLEMCKAFDIQLDPVLLKHKIHTSGLYMSTVIKNARPEILRGYGDLDTADEQLLNEHIDRIAQIVHKL